MIQILSRSDKITSKSRQKEYYSDFSRNLDLNPVTGFLVRLTNEDAIKASMENLIMTMNGERYYHDTIGSTVMASMFDLQDELTIHKIKTSIETCLRNNEPRASNVMVEVHPDVINNLLTVNIKFVSVNLPNQVQELNITRRIR
jgi:phage baseplate assembly protein W